MHTKYFTVKRKKKSPDRYYRTLTQLTLYYLQTDQFANSPCDVAQGIFARLVLMWKKA